VTGAAADIERRFWRFAWCLRVAPVGRKECAHFCRRAKRPRTS
jgi:hypothetical protein